MSITQEAIPANFLSAYQADKPCFVVKNILTGAGYSAVVDKWYRAATGGAGVVYANKPSFTAAGDGTLADNSALPIKYTHDNRAAIYSSPDDGSAQNDFFWGLYGARWNTLVGASTSEYPQVYYLDSMVIKSHAWGKGTAAAYLTNDFLASVDLSTATDFAAINTTVGVFSKAAYLDDPSSNPHPVQSGVSHTLSQVIPNFGNYRYKIDGDAFARVEYFAKGGAGNYWTTVPKIGEVFIGERIQLSRNTNQPYATELAYMNNSTDFESSRGDIVRYVRSKGRRRFELDFTPTGDDTYGIDDLVQFRLLAKKTNQFTEPFMYIPKPFSEPQNAFFVYAEDASFSMAAVGPFERSVKLSLVEIPPFVAYQTGV